AEKVWTGWNNYKDVPFLFEYPNGMRMLVGHPSPPDGFELVPGVQVGEKKVYLDRGNVVPIELTPPLAGGGGPIPFGKEKRVRTVSLDLSPIPKESTDQAFPGDEQLLVNIHELFHCFQRQIYRRNFGNLRYNTDANYAIFSEIEGWALEKAYLEPDDRKAREFLKDFIAARELKRKSMNDEQQSQESDEDFMEGTAVYAETMTLELLKKGYQPIITGKDDPSFSGFKHIDLLLEKKLKELRTSRSQTMVSRLKCYYYGCFQALLLNRFVPGWQGKVQQSHQPLDQVLSQYLNISPEEKTSIQQRLKSRYPYREIEEKHTTLIKKRNEAYEMIQKRKGRKYIINFKPTREFLDFTSGGESYKLGLIRIYPEGIQKVQVQEVIFEGKKTPMVNDRLYYIKWIDTEAGPAQKSYELSYSKKEGENIYEDAVFTTKGFVLKAPKIQVKDRPARVKVTILSKVKAK
ncbi:MAG: hypothetical protein JSV88_20535, partial [Candidatus Aminicenantes bacterium]